MITVIVGIVGLIIGSAIGYRAGYVAGMQDGKLVATPRVAAVAPVSKKVVVKPAKAPVKVAAARTAPKKTKTRGKARKGRKS